MKWLEYWGKPIREKTFLCQRFWHTITLITQMWRIPWTLTVCLRMLSLIHCDLFICKQCMTNSVQRLRNTDAQCADVVILCIPLKFSESLGDKTVHAVSIMNKPCIHIVIHNNPSMLSRYKSTLNIARYLWKFTRLFKKAKISKLWKGLKLRLDDKNNSISCWW